MAPVHCSIPCSMIPIIPYHAGCPVRYYMLEDILAPGFNASPLKLAIFLNAWRLKPGLCCVLQLYNNPEAYIHVLHWQHCTIVLRPGLYSRAFTCIGVNMTAVKAAITATLETDNRTLVYL